MQRNKNFLTYKHFLTFLRTTLPVNGLIANNVCVKKN